MPSPPPRPVLARLSVSDGVIPRHDVAAAVTAAFNRTMSRRSLLAALGVTALLAGVARGRSDSASSVEATGWLPPPDYHGIVGVL
jgi:hypothetical protein